MSGHHFYEFKIGSKNEDIKKNRDSLENLIVTGQEVKDDSEVSHKVGCDDHSPMRDVVTSRSVSKEALTLGDIISMENSQKPPNNINGPEENVDQETGQETTEEPKADNMRDFDGNFENRKKSELESRRLIYALEDSYDDHNFVSSNFPNGFGERSFSEAESGLAHITYSGSISVPGSISFRSDGSTVSTSSFAFPILQSEWNSSPVRMVKAQKEQLRKEKGWRHYSLLLCCRF